MIFIFIGDNNIMQFKKRCSVYDDLKMIIIDHQKVIK